VLGASGYVRLSRGAWTVIFDAAAVGADCVPGHAHADTLAVEIAYDDVNLITNSGTSTYEIGQTRGWERSTRAHATVEVDEENSSEVWASFRVGRRARPFCRSLSESVECLTAAAAHDGYRYLPGAPVHHRSITLSDSCVRIIDWVRGKGHHRIAIRFPLPAGATTAIGEKKVLVDLVEKRRFEFSVDGGDLDVELGHLALKFDSTVRRPVIVVRADSMLPVRVETVIACVSCC